MESHVNEVEEPYNNVFASFKAKAQPETKKSKKAHLNYSQDQCFGVQPLPSDNMNKIMEQ